MEVKDREESSSSKKGEVKIGDIIDLSSFEIVILIFLLKHTKPIVRYSLFLTVKNHLNAEKSISTSSFYNSLKKLEQKGLLKFTKLEDGKIKSVKKTALTNKAVNCFLEYILKLRIIEGPEISFNLLKRAQEQVGKIVETLLIIWTDDFIEGDVIELIASSSKECFIYAREDSHLAIDNLNVRNLRYTNIFNEQIREPNEAFDVIYYPFYSRLPDAGNFTRIELLKEFKRILKKNGTAIILVRKHFLEAEPHYANFIIKIFNDAMVSRTFSEKELNDDFQEAGFTRMHMVEYKGNFLVFGWKN